MSVFPVPGSRLNRIHSPSGEMEQNSYRPEIGESPRTRCWSVPSESISQRACPRVNEMRDPSGEYPPEPQMVDSLAAPEVSWTAPDPSEFIRNIWWE